MIQGSMRTSEEQAKQPPVKVLYIAGAGRSGSTIIQNVLGETIGFEAVGELRDFWSRGEIRNRLCGCGVTFQSCDFWHEIRETLYSRSPKIIAEDVARSADAFRTRDMFRFPVPGFERRLLLRSRSYRDILNDLYSAIRQVSNARVIVDASKSPAYGYLLCRTPGLAVYVIHLIRDSRAVAYSTQRRKWFEEGVEMPRYSTSRVAMAWTSKNLAAGVKLRQYACDYLRLRYEDFVSAPGSWVRRITEMVEESATTEYQKNPTRIELGVHHTVHGNPVRFQSGSVELRIDDEWVTKLQPSRRRMMTAVTFPLLMKYGYLGCPARDHS